MTWASAAPTYANAADATAASTAQAATPTSAASDAQDPDTSPSAQMLQSGYSGPVRGAPFFLLADSGFTSSQTARVRVEGDPDTFAEYGGVDIVLYQIPHPLDFLKKQKDLHRIQVEGNYSGDGLQNTVNFLWDKWFKKSRMVFQQLFTEQARSAVTDVAPAMKQASPGSYTTTFHATPQYRPLKQFTLVQRFRYPVADSRPIAPPSDLHLAGSSSDFISPQQGDVYVPLGKLKPGLYLVEAYVGAHRATTLVFVSDTVAVSKTAGKSVLVWTVERDSGKPVKGADIAWTDGNGTLQSGSTASDGFVTMDRAVPSRSYTIGQDAQGGVFVSENFYYDSEIYNSKLYLFTDRPLYKPGDTVRMKLYGRAFEDARRSHAVEAARTQVSLIDPAGNVLLSQPLSINADTGGDTSMTLPANAYPGGYTLQFTYQGAQYGAMFRVADYAKPAFDVAIHLDQPTFVVGEKLTGSVALHYPDGSPLRDATVALDIKQQALSATNGDRAYGNAFPRKVFSKSYKADAHGVVRFALPAATSPSRYFLQAVASDHGIFPVSANLEAVVQPAERAASAQTGTASSQATSSTPPTSTAQAQPALQGAIGLRFDKTRYQVGDTAHLAITLPTAVDDALLTLERDKVEARALLSKGADWLTLHRVDDTHWQADIPVKENYGPNITFSLLYVKQGDFNFQNAGLQVVVPSIDVAIHTDKRDYQPGDKVTVDLTTRVSGKPVSAIVSAAVVDEMVFTLQPEVAPSIFDFFYHPRRDNVRTTASLNFYGYDLAWAPNVANSAKFDYNQRAFKVLTRPRRENIDTAAWQPTLHTGADGKVSFSFIMPDSLSRWRITARGMTADGVVGQQTGSITSSKPVYLRWSGPTHWRAGDAPHVGLLVVNAKSGPVTASLHVAGIDDARPASTTVTAATASGGAGASAATAVSATANNATPSIASGASGASVASLASGASGASLASVGAATSPGTATLGADAVTTVGAGGLDRTITLRPGENYIDLPFIASHDTVVDLQLKDGQQMLDRLQVPLEVVPAGWVSPDSVVVHPSDPLTLPADASALTLRAVSSTSQAFASVMDGLIATPSGSAEQTASQMISLTMALDALPPADAGNGSPASAALRNRLVAALQTARGRLMSLAGPNADFAWWGDQTNGDPLQTAYVYYADWRATQRLHIAVSPDHWQRVFDTYQNQGKGMTLLHRALTVWLMQQMQLPVKTLLGGLQTEVIRAAGTTRKPEVAAPTVAASTSTANATNAANATPAADDRRRSALMTPASHDVDWDLTLLLLRNIRAHAGAADDGGLPASVATQMAKAAQTLPSSANPVVASLALGLSGSAADAAQSTRATSLLGRLDNGTPTFDRAIALVNLETAAKRGDAGIATRDLGLRAPWRFVDDAGGGAWHWQGNGSNRVPAALSFAHTPDAASLLRIDFNTAGNEQSTLPIKLTRTVYQLTAGDKTGIFSASKMTSVYDANGLYVDEITLTPTDAKHVFREGVLEVPLPSGASNESQRYGFQVDGLPPLQAKASSSHGDSDNGLDDGPVNDDGTPMLSSIGVLSQDRIEARDGYYLVPVSRLQGKIVIRHLLRFGQPGRFVMPAARYYRVYDPSAKAYDAAGATAWTVQ
jgi:uncharacterized protein YfaS (alpha-2-macroglobulin family)